MPAPSSRIGWFTAACVLVSNIIGGAIFSSTGFMARDLGDPLLILLLWAVGGVIAIAGAMSYAELGAAMPQAGGDYVYLRQAYGPLVGFLSGWTSFTIGFSAAIAAASVSFAAYVFRVVQLDDNHVLISKVLALGLVWTLTAVHALGIAAGGRLQRVLTTTKVLAIFALIVGGLTLGTGQWSNLTAADPGSDPEAGPIVVALIFVLYAYLGWNVVGYIAGEINDPQRNIPRIVVGGTAFVALIYLLLNVTYFYALPVRALAEPPLLPVAEKAATALWGPVGGRFIAGLLCISIAGGISAMVWAGPRVYWKMASDGVFAAFFSKLHSHTGVPVRAIVLQSLWTSLLILTGTFEQLVIFSGFVLSAFTALTIGSVIVLRRRHPELARPYRVPLYPLVPGIALTVLLIIVGYSLAARPLESAFGAATVLAGLPFYLLWRRAG